MTFLETSSNLDITVHKPFQEIKYDLLSNAYVYVAGQAIANTTRRFQRGSDLYITRADRERDSGHFTCIAQDINTGLSITSSAASLNVQCKFSVSRNMWCCHNLTSVNIFRTFVKNKLDDLKTFRFLYFIFCRRPLW